MSQNGTLDTVEYTTGQIAERLNIPEAQVRIAAKQLQIEAPYSAGHLDAFTLHFERVNGTQANAVKPMAIAPAHEQPTEAIAASGENLPPAFAAFCDSLEAEITQSLKAEMASRMPQIKAAVMDAII